VHPRGEPLLTLAIETANPGTAEPGGGGGGVAIGLIGDTVDVIAAERLREVDRDRDDLIPAIERLLAAARRSRADLRCIAASIGPGGFTSTRVACATGALLAEGLGVPVRPVPSALAAHAAWIAAGGGASTRCAVLMATKGEQAWCALIPPEPGAAPDAARAGSMMSSAEVLALRPGVALADRHLPASMREALLAAGIPLHPLRFTPQATLAAAALVDSTDPAALIPIYPREPEAVTLWRQRRAANL